MIKSKYGFTAATDDRLAQNIYYLRRKKRMSRETFSEKMGMNNNMLFCLEKHLFPAIMDDALANVCSYYNITPEDLFYTDLKEAAKTTKRKK